MMAGRVGDWVTGAERVDRVRQSREEVNCLPELDNYDGDHLTDLSGRW